MKTRLELAAVAKAFGRHQVLNQTWLQARAGEAVGLIGANGAGKTTLLRIAAGLVRPDGGSVRWCGVQDDQPARIRYYGGEVTLPPSISARRWASLFGVSVDDMSLMPGPDASLGTTSFDWWLANVPPPPKK